MHKRYFQLLSTLKEKDPTANVDPAVSVFAATTFNVGECVETIPHRDFMNFAAGMCSITALGNFDPKKGGHLVLWELGLIVEFPPASTIFIPSASVTHSNAAVHGGRVRMSITQYTAAGLFRWAACKYMSLAGFAETHPELKEVYDAGAKSRAADAMKMYLTLKQLSGLCT